MKRTKPSLNDAADAVLQQAANARNQAASVALLAAKDEYTGSAVNLRKSDWKFLRRVAEARADRNGGRPSVSKVVESIIDALRKDLESELE